MEPGVPEAAVQTRGHSVPGRNPLPQGITCPLSPGGSSSRGGSFPSAPALITVSSQWRPGLLVPHASFSKQPVLSCGSPSPPGARAHWAAARWPCQAVPAPTGSARDCPRRWQMLHILRSLACPAVLHLPELVPPSSTPAPLGPEDAGPAGTAGAPPRPGLGLSPISVSIPAKGACSPGRVSLPCPGEALRSFTLFCPEVLFHSPRPCRLLEV